MPSENSALQPAYIFRLIRWPVLPDLNARDRLRAYAERFGYIFLAITCRNRCANSHVPNALTVDGGQRRSRRITYWRKPLGTDYLWTAKEQSND